MTEHPGLPAGTRPHEPGLLVTITGSDDSAAARAAAVVVFLRLPRTAPAMPRARISRSTVHRAACSPSRCS